VIADNTARSGLSIQMGSDWGSVFPGQAVYLVIQVRNNRTAGGSSFSNLKLSSVLPANLDILGAEGDPQTLEVKLNGNNLTLDRGELKAGEGFVVGIRARVKGDVAPGTVLITQATLSYEGLRFPARSNLVRLEVVGSPGAQVNVTGGGNQANATATTTPISAYPGPATATPIAPTATAAAATSAPATTATVAPTSGLAATVAPLTAVPTNPAPTSAPVARPPTSSGELPETSGGIPIGGLALLGGTLLVRTVRVRRDKSRI
jgi:hypothetical protein